MNNNILALIEQYEVAYKQGFFTSNIVDKVELECAIYGELIMAGFIPRDLLDENAVADILLIDFEYEFTEEEVLLYLVHEIADVADSDYEMYEAEFLEIENSNVDMIPEGDYILVNLNLNISEGNKSLNIIPAIFSSLDEINEYVEDRAKTMVFYNTMEEIDTTVGITDMLDVQNAYDIYAMMGTAFEVVAEHISKEAVAVVSIVQYVGDSQEIEAVQLYTVFEATYYKHLI